MRLSRVAVQKSAGAARVAKRPPRRSRRVPEISALLKLSRTMVNGIERRFADAGAQRIRSHPDQDEKAGLRR
jgi:hypothetical protein